MATIQDLRLCLEAVTSVRSRISQVHIPDTKHSQNFELIELVLPQRSTDALESAMANQGVSNSAKLSVLAIYKAKYSQLEATVVRTYRSAMKTLVNCEGGAESYQRKFQSRLTQVFKDAVSRMQSEIIRAIAESQDRCRGYVDSENLFSQSEDHDTSSRRGHDSIAVQILERAYAHTPNITQAEKYKLAEATGLQPRQVTIWFQNQRNRKSKKQTKVEPEPEQEASATDSTNGKRKPAYGHYLGLGVPADVSDGESAVSSCASKRRRTIRLASDESNGSTGTLDSFSSHNDWSASSSSGSSVCDEFFTQKEESDANTLGNVFHRLCLPSDVDQPMPDLTMHLSSTDKSPLEASVSSAFRFPADTHSLFSDQADSWPEQIFHPQSSSAQLDFADLQLDEDALNRALQQSLEKAFVFPDVATPARSSTVPVRFATPENDEDEWIDEEDFTRAPRKIQPHGRLFGQGSDDTPTHPRQPVQWHQTPQQAAHQPLSSNSQPSPDSNMSDADASFLHTLNGINNPATTGGDGQPFLNLEIDFAELDLFFQQSSQPAAQQQQDQGQYMFNFDISISDVLLPVPNL
nr:homeodomain transcription factor bW [Farysia itapuensis]